MANGLGFPDATDTGVPAAVKLTPYYGDLVINTPGAVVEGLDIHGSVIINANNVTLQHCKITDPSGFFLVGVEGSGAIVQDCEINGGGAGPQGSAGIAGSGQFLRNNIYGVENGILVASNTLVQDNFIHDLNAGGEPHIDGVQISGGVSNVVIRHNQIQSWDTSCVYITNDFGAVNNIIVDNNLLVKDPNHTAPSFPVYSDEKSRNSGQITNVQFTNNIMQVGYYGGYASIVNNSVIWQGNTDLATSRTISLNGTLSLDPTPVSLDPTPVALTVAAFSADSGVVGDHITNDNTLRLTGTAPANSTVKVYDGATQIGSTTAGSSGAWSYLTGTVPDGLHNLTARATSGGTTSAPLSVTVDTVAPSAPIINGSSINSNKVTLSGSAEANGTVSVYDAGALLGQTTANSSGTWSYTTSTLSNATHNFTATATDAAGNTSAASNTTSLNFTTATVSSRHHHNDHWHRNASQSSSLPSTNVASGNNTTLSASADSTSTAANTALLIQEMAASPGRSARGLDGTVFHDPQSTTLTETLTQSPQHLNHR